MREETRWWHKQDSGNLLPKTYILLKIQQIQLFLEEERPEDTGQQPDYIFTYQNPVPHEGDKIQAAAQWDPSAPHPSSWWEERSQRREGEGAKDC